MLEHFDAVVIGSGFGGAVMAYELSAGGLSVCLLERGKAYPPGSFPRSPYRMGRNFWDPSEGLYGMFDAWSFRHSEALVASGLGGGSLIYANVLIRKPPAWFNELQPDGTYKPWSVSRQDLDPHYTEVEKVLGVQPYPLHVLPYSQTPKTLAFRDAAARLNLKWELPNLAISFARNASAAPVPAEQMEEPYPNLHNRPRLTCRLCGECDIGCNYGSKNTLDFNYLTMAQRNGAIIRHLCEAKALRLREGGGYEIDYVKHDIDDRDRRKGSPKPYNLTADRLILCAGTLGSTYLLLKNQKNFPNLSKTLGSRYSTNGDLLTFAMRCTNRSANSATPRIIDPSRGPVITSTINVELQPHGGFLIQDAGYPEFINWLVEVADAPGRVKRLIRFAWRRVKEWISGEPHPEIDGQVADIIGPCELSSGSIPLLGMGRDLPNGNMRLTDAKDGRQYLQVDWRSTASTEYFKTLSGCCRRVAEAMGGTFTQNPTTKLLGRIVTVHPLGGCPMGANTHEGVVNAYGEVFNYPGLYVADGSIMPGPVGSNPSLTIAAMARRIALSILNQQSMRRSI